MRTERACAKINLFLNVTARRENGYHDLVSIMQTVSLCDLVTVDFMPGAHTSVSLSVSGNDLVPTDCRNLAWRAAELFLQRVQKSGTVHIFIEKHIPMAGGLAGGSADAAAVFRALNRLCGNPLTVGDLCTLGARLGADIPFCIVGGAMLVGGIGERLEEIPPMPRCPLLVASMGEGVSTPWAYGRLDELYHDFEEVSAARPSPDPIVDLFRSGHTTDMGKYCYNMFEEAVPAVRPSVGILKTAMTEAGAIHAMMSGSGPSVFGIFNSQEDASAAVKRLCDMGAAAFVCYPYPKYT